MNFIKDTLKNIVAFFISISVGLMIGELIIRFFFPQILSPVQFYYDSKLGGMIPVPDQIGFKRHPGEYYYTYKNNEIGMRDTRQMTDFKKIPYKILAIGDSFTYGWGVNDSETFCKVLENKINTDSIAVLNAGASGSGTDYALRFFNVRGSELSPKAVLYFYYENDMADNSENRYFTIENDSIIDKNENPTASLNAIQKNKLANNSVYNWFSAHSHLFSMIRTQIGLMWNQKVKKENQAPENKSQVIQNSNVAIAVTQNSKSQPVIRDNFYYTYKYLKALSINVEKSGAKFYTFFIPSNTSIAEFEKTGRMNHEEAIANFCKENKIQFYSFKDVIMKNKTPFKTYYYPTDLHWNKAGHEIAGKYVFEVLNQTLLTSSKK